MTLLLNPGNLPISPSDKRVLMEFSKDLEQVFGRPVYRIVISPDYFNASRTCPHAVTFRFEREEVSRD
jgi:hypothetical protein